MIIYVCQTWAKGAPERPEQVSGRDSLKAAILCVMKSLHTALLPREAPVEATFLNTSRQKFFSEHSVS